MKGDFLKRARMTGGSVVSNKRHACWNFLWFEDGHRRSRKLGNFSELRTREAALKKLRP